MTDWLQQILSRALGSEAEIRPRPLARFEDGVTGEWAEPQPAQADAQSPPLTQSAEANRSHQARFEPVTPPLSAQPTSSFFAEPSPLPERSDSLARLSDPIIEPRREITELFTSSREEKVIHTTKVVERLLAEHDDEQLPAPTMPSVRSNAEPAKPALLQPAPIAASDPLVERKESASSTTPTVRISIGRIEISVAPAPSAAARPLPRPAPSPLKPARSLDDYLRRRNGGER